MAADAILKIRWLGVGLAGLLAAASAALATDQTRTQAPDALAGKAVFAANCALCHSAVPGDGGGGMGPRLFDLFDRAATNSDTNFPYTAALRASKLTWDADTLDRFLTSPGKIVPGTAMIAEVPDGAERKALVAYFRALQTPEPPA